jgi:signal transduction histidine kinase
MQHRNGSSPGVPSREEPRVVLNKARSAVPAEIEGFDSSQPGPSAVAELMHDLRSPLTAISNTLHLLRKEMGEAEGKVRRYLELMDRQVGRIEALLHDFDGN